MATVKQPFQTKPATGGEKPVFTGTDVPIRDFIDWYMGGGTLSGFIERNPEVTRQHIRDYLLSAMPEKILAFGEERDWAQ